MTHYGKLTTKDTALTVTFTALYAVFGFIKISPIIGLSGQAITAAAFIAPIIGILLGPYVGTLSAFLGGTIGFFLGALSYPRLRLRHCCSILCRNGQKRKKNSQHTCLPFSATAFCVLSNCRTCMAVPPRTVVPDSRPHRSGFAPAVRGCKVSRIWKQPKTAPRIFHHMPDVHTRRSDCRVINL